MSLVLPTFEREKFRELLVHIAQQTADDLSWGDTKTNKTLHWVDFFGYSHLGRPVTGARYFKLENGPCAKALVPVRDELVDEGALEVIEPSAKYQPRRMNALRDPDMSDFTEEEMDLIASIIGQVRGQSAKAVSRHSHEYLGWQVVELYDDIPYETALASKESPSEGSLSKARELAAARAY